MLILLKTQLQQEKLSNNTDADTDSSKNSGRSHTPKQAQSQPTDTGATTIAYTCYNILDCLSKIN
jgi:hypothetical protein